MEERKTCKHCKKEINKKVKICPYCLKIQSNSIVMGIGLFLLAIIIVVGGISSTFNNSMSSSNKKRSSELKKEKSNYSTNNIQENELKANSNEKLNYLVKKGQNKAKDANTNEIEKALNYIKNNIDNPFANNTITENLIYYGTVLEYYYAKDGFTDIKGEIGMYTVIAVKYVYRNIETSTDYATMRNINEVKERLTKIN